MVNFDYENDDDYLTEFDDISKEINIVKSTVVLSIYSKKGLEDVIEGYEEVIKALDKWRKKNKIVNNK
jgi:predicted DNA-binding protein YlxM (UPF0122 family)